MQCNRDEETHYGDDNCTDGKRRDWRLNFDTHTHSGLYLLQSTDVGDNIWSVVLCAAADPGHLFCRSLPGQCVKSYVNIQILR